MSTTFAQPVNTFKTTLASGHTAADGHLVLALSPGVLASGRLWRVTALQNPDTASESTLCIFEATSSSGVTLSGVTAAEGYSDLNVASGVAIQIRMTAKDLSEVQAAVNAAETSIATNTSAITTIQTSQTADEATLASHTTELASHAATLATDATAITSLQTSRTADEATLASHTTELASHASAITTIAASQATDEATIASHTTELASHASTLTTDGTAITSLQSNQTTDEATLASHTTELASHAAELAALPAANLIGSHTLPDGVLSTNVPLINANNHFTKGQDITPGASGAVLYIHRLNSGADNGATWVFQIDNAGASDTVLFGCSSSTYSTGGALTWIGNSQPFIYYPSANGLKIGTGTGATPTLVLDSSLNATFGGIVAAVTFSGSGASLTGIPQSGVTGLVAALALLAPLASPTFTGTVTATTFSGSGASLTSLPAANVTGSHTLPDGVLSTNVPLLNAANTFTGLLTNTNDTGPTVKSATANGGPSQINLTPQNTAGNASGGAAAINCYDGAAALGGRLIGAFGNSAGARYLGFQGGVDRDGNKLPIWFFTQDAAGALQLALTIAAGQTGGTVGAVGIGGALNVTGTISGPGGGITGLTEAHVTNLVSDLALKAPLAAPTFTGVVTFAGGSSIDASGYGFIEKMTFLLAQGQTLTNGTYPVGTVGVFASDAGKIWKWKLRAGTNPAGGAGGFSFDIKKNGTTILSAPIAVAANTTTLQTGNTFSVTTVAEGDEFTVAITSAGTAVQNVTLILYSLVRNA